MRGTKAKQLRQIATIMSEQQKVPTRYVYRRLKQLYKSDPIGRSAYNRTYLGNE